MHFDVLSFCFLYVMRFRGPRLLATFQYKGFYPKKKKKKKMLQENSVADSDEEDDNDVGELLHVPANMYSAARDR